MATKVTTQEIIEFLRVVSSTKKKAARINLNEYYAPKAAYVSKNTPEIGPCVKEHAIYYIKHIETNAIMINVFQTKYSIKSQSLVLQQLPNVYPHKIVGKSTAAYKTGIIIEDKDNKISNSVDETYRTIKENLKKSEVLQDQECLAVMNKYLTDENLKEKKDELFGLEHHIDFTTKHEELRVALTRSTVDSFTENGVILMKIALDDSLSYEIKKEALELAKSQVELPLKDRKKSIFILLEETKKHLDATRYNNTHITN